MTGLKIIMILVIGFQISNLNEARAIQNLSDEDKELEKDLKILHKQHIKTFQMKEADIVDCIDIYKQPALDLPLLKNHKVQLIPTSWPKRVVKKDSSEVTSLVHLSSGIRCPEGMVPIRRTRKDDLARAKYFSNLYVPDIHRHDSSVSGIHVASLLSVAPKIKYFGVGGVINLYNVEVKDDQYSSAQMWIENGPDGRHNSIQFGWLISPKLFGDNHTHLFVYWTMDGSRTGCFNNLCPGFVQVDKEVILGEKLFPVSQYDGHQYMIELNVFQDKNTGNWWLVADDERKLGYWPKSILPNLATGASFIAWGGLAAGPPTGDSPPMGNGHRSDDEKACYIRDIHFSDISNNYYEPDPNDLQYYIDQPNCYDLKYYPSDPKILFGGPGGNCN